MGTQLVAISDSAQRIGVSTYTVRRLIARGEIASVNVGARRLIPETEIERIVTRGVGRARTKRPNLTNCKA
jgi:excisionase family DNA binding protein